MSPAKYGIEFKKRDTDKVEASKAFDRPRFSGDWPDVPEADARQDDEFGNRGEGIFDVLTDEEDGMLAMFKAIRDMLFPPEDEATEEEKRRESNEEGDEEGEGENQGEPDQKNRSEQKKKSKKSMPAWQVDTIDQFLRAWHHIEVSTAARMLVTDEDYSVLNIFREVGTETFDELSVGSRRLSQSVLANMRVAVEAAQRLSKTAVLLTAEAFIPDSPRIEDAQEAGDVSMVGMFKAEEW